MKCWLSGQDTGQGRWASSPGSGAKAPEGSSCLRVAGRSPATRSSQGQGNAGTCGIHAKSVRRNEVRKPWRVHGICWVTLKGSQALPQPLIHGKNLNTAFTTLPLLTQLHTALLWGWTYTEVGWKKSTWKITLCFKRAQETRQEVVSYSQPARRYW